MSREIRRVPLDFNWPLDTVYAPFAMPKELHGITCPACEGSGQSPRARQLQRLWYGYEHFRPEDNSSAPFTVETPEVRAFAERQVARDPGYYGTGEAAILREARRMLRYWNVQWSHHLSQEQVDLVAAAGHLKELTHTQDERGKWQPIEPTPAISAETANRSSLTSTFGYSSSVLWQLQQDICAREGVGTSCPVCKGEGETWRNAQHKSDYESWQPQELPTGEGWQLWGTTSEGTPMSPVFAEAEELARWMAVHPIGFAGGSITLEQARAFIASGHSSPSLVSRGGRTVDGMVAIAESQAAGE